MKKVAVILFGQPRYFDITWPLIKQEFTFEDVHVDYYIHFWDQVGHTPESTEVDASTHYNINTILKREFYDHNVQFDDYTELDELCLTLRSFFNNVLQTEREDSFIEEPLEHLRYRFGQHLSIKKAYNKILKHESNNKFEYDLIIKTRSDIIYRNPGCYTGYDRDYNTIKTDYYFKEPEYYNSSADGYIKCNALRIMDFRNAMYNTGEDISQVIDAFYLNKYQCLNTEDQWIDLVQDYFVRIALNDWTLTASRNAADVFFGKYFKNFNCTVVRDLLENPTTCGLKKRIISSEHCIQGQFLSNYNILASLPLKEIRRDVRLLNKNEIKDGVEPRGKLLCVDGVTTTEYLEDALVRGWSLDKRAREIKAKEMSFKYKT